MACNCGILRIGSLSIGCVHLAEARARALYEASQHEKDGAEARRYWCTLSESARFKYRSDPRIWEHPHGAPGVAYDDSRLN